MFEIKTTVADGIFGLTTVTLNPKGIDAQITFDEASLETRMLPFVLGFCFCVFQLSCNFFFDRHRAILQKQ
jgi:hypothetical protein